MITVNPERQVWTISLVGHCDPIRRSLIPSPVHLSGWNYFLCCGLKVVGWECVFTQCLSFLSKLHFSSPVPSGVRAKWTSVELTVYVMFTPGRGASSRSSVCGEDGIHVRQKTQASLALYLSAWRKYSAGTHSVGVCVHVCIQIQLLINK